MPNPPNCTAPALADDEREFLRLLGQVPAAERAGLMFDCLLVALAAADNHAEPLQA